MGLLLAITLLATAGTPAGVITKPVANMHSHPSEEADVVSQAIYATNVGWLQEKDGWVKVRTPDDYTGWMRLTALRRLRSGAGPYARAGRVAEVEALFANLYREPSVTKHQPLLTVPFETRLEVVAEPEAEDRRWIQVRLPDDRPAWVQRGDVTFHARRLTIDETIALSKRFVELSYLWGGTSTFGYDCSGFTQMLCRRRGISIPRDAGPQARWEGAVPVEGNDLRPGDLLFFGESATKITHTGMYIGKGEFINATTHERPAVQISRLEDPHWSRLFVGARRLN